MKIERDLQSGRYPPGAFMGAQAELCASYGVTAPTLTQASRILVNRGLVSIRAGKGGGMFAVDHSVEHVGKRVATYLECAGVSYEAAAPVSRLFQDMCVRSAATNGLPFEVAASIRAALANVPRNDEFEHGRVLRGVFEQFADASGNPVFAFLYRVITDVIFEISVDEVARSRGNPQTPLEKRMIEAVIAADPDEASAAIRLYQQRLNNLQASREMRPDLHDFAKRRSGVGRLPERLASHMLREIRLGHWRPGTNIGREPDLMKRYGVSRATLRQALRLLEEYSAVETKRGPRGGVFAVSPNATTVNRTALTLLQRRGATIAMVRTLLAPLLGLALDTALARGQAAREEIMRATLKTPRRGALTETLTAESRNVVLDVFVRLLSKLENEIEKPAPRTARVETLQKHFHSAIAADDRGAARCALIELVQIGGAP